MTTDRYIGTNDIEIKINPDNILNAAIYRNTTLKEINPSTVGNNKWLEMVDQNNAKETDQFNEAYLWTQSVLNNLREIGQAEDYKLKLSSKKASQQHEVL
ncbi:hypothetical protein K4U78_11175 [Staphylococcus epidermidis]|nr:hypothetical protein [Staphylococcus epidermidis]